MRIRPPFEWYDAGDGRQCVYAAEARWQYSVVPDNQWGVGYALVHESVPSLPTSEFEAMLQAASEGVASANAPDAT